MLPTSILKEVRDLRKSGKFKDALALLDNYFDQLGPDERHERIKGLNERSMCFLRLAQLENAERQAFEALKLAEQSPVILEGLGSAFNNLGNVHWSHGKLNRAEDYYKRSLTIREKLDDQSNISGSLTNLGNVYWQRGDLSHAEECHKRSLIIYEKLNDAEGIAVSTNNLGNVYFQRGDYNNSKECFLRSLAIREELKTPQYIATALINLGNVYVRCGELEQAQDVLQRSLDLHLEKSNPQYIADARHQLVRVLLRQENLNDADKQVEELAKLAQKTGIQEVVLRHLLAKSFLKLRQLDFPQALSCSNDAKDLAKQLPHFEMLVDSLELLVQIYVQMYLLTSQSQYKDQINDLLQSLIQLSKRENLHGVYVGTCFIQALLKRSEFDLEGAIKQFKLTELLAQEQGIQPIAQRARKELNQLIEHTDKLKSLMRLSPGAYEQLQMREILDYMQEAKQVVLG